MLFDDLRRNRIIRNFLHHFSESSWEELVKLLVIFAIQSLEINSPKPLQITIEDIKHQILRLGSASAVQAKLPMIESSLQSAAEDINSLRDEINPTASRKLNAKNLSTNTYENESAKPVTQTIRDSRINVNNDCGKKRVQHSDSRDLYLRSVKTELRSQHSRQTVHGLGFQDPTGSVKQIMGGDVTLPDPASRAESRLRKSQGKLNKRLDPRLAYSMPMENRDKLPYEDDIVSTHYLDVPSSGYGNVPTRERKDERICKSERSNQRERSPNDHKKALVNDRGSSAAISTKLRKIPAHLKGVQSKIKERVRADKQAYMSRKAGRNQTMRNIAAYGVGHVPEDVQAKVKHMKKLEGSVLEIADSVLNDETMDAFLESNKSFDPIVFQKPVTKAQTSEPCSVGQQPATSNDDLAEQLRSWGLRSVPQSETIAPTASCGVDEATPHSPSNNATEPVFDRLEPSARKVGIAQSMHWRHDSKTWEPDHPRANFAGWLGEYGEPHTWTNRTADSFYEGYVTSPAIDDEQKSRSGDSFHLHTPDSVEWHFEKILDTNENAI